MTPWESSSSPAGPMSLHPGEPARSPDHAHRRFDPQLHGVCHRKLHLGRATDRAKDPDPLQLPLGADDSHLLLGGKLARLTQLILRLQRVAAARRAPAGPPGTDARAVPRCPTGTNRTACGPKPSARSCGSSILAFPNHSTYFPWDSALPGLILRRQKIQVQPHWYSIHFYLLLI